MDQPPFDRENELYRKLEVFQYPPSIHRQSATSSKGTIATTKSWLPGQPRIDLHDNELGTYLASEFVTEDLDKLAPHLWLVAKQDSSSISSLTQQIVQGRGIVITENPGLHLVWIYDRIYIKPIPKFLLSHAFWDFYFTKYDSPLPVFLNEKIVKAALGFLRSYVCLIQHKSDFDIATNDSHRLIPKGISYAQFVNFIKAFDKNRISDDVVSLRYTFGELRLIWLDLWSIIFLRRLKYQKAQGQYGARLSQFYGPVVFIFGVFSVLLSAMEVALAVQSLVQSGHSWVTFAHVSRWFSIFTIVCSVVLVVVPLVWVLIFSSYEAVFVVRRFAGKRMLSKNEQVKERNSAVV